MLYDIEALEREADRLLKDRDILREQLEGLSKKHQKREMLVCRWAEVSQQYDAAKQKLEEARLCNAGEIADVLKLDVRDPINLLANAYKLLELVRAEFPDEDQSVIENIRQYLIDFCEGRVDRPKELVESRPEIISLGLKQEFGSCQWTGKVSYTDRKFADLQRTELLRQYGKTKGVSTSVYRCRFCKHWHVGRKLEMVG